MADLMNVLREAERYEDLIQRLAPERPVVERGDPFHNYDDNEFCRRYRLSKRTAIAVIEEVKDNLERVRSDQTAYPAVHIQFLSVLRFYAVDKFLLWEIRISSAIITQNVRVGMVGL